MLSTSVQKLLELRNPEKGIKNRKVVGLPVISVKIGDHCYHGLCDIGASVSAIPHYLYQEMREEITPVEIEHIDVVGERSI